MRRQSENESERAPSLRRRAVLWGAPVALLALAAGLFVRRPIAVRTSLDDLVGDGVEAIPAAVRAASADLVPVLVGPADDVAQAVAAARAIQARLPSDKLVPTAENPLAALATNRYGLAALDDVRLLETSEGRARVAQKALKKFYASPLPPLFPVAEDPFALADGFVRAQMSARANWNVRDGLLTATDGHGATSVVLPLRLRPEIAADADALIVFRAELNAVLSAVRAAFPSVSVAACGVPLHTAVTAGNCKREINALSIFSFVFIALLSVFAFRSVRWIPLLAASLAVAALAGAAALLALFSEIHLMTVVFGTTVMGLVIDYSFHWLLADARRAAVTRNLAVSWLTTEISLVPLMVSSLPVLRQSAVFLGVGLAAALAYVVGGYPTRRRMPDGLAHTEARRFSLGGARGVLPCRLANCCRPVSRPFRNRPDGAVPSADGTRGGGTAFCGIERLGGCGARVPRLRPRDGCRACREAVRRTGRAPEAEAGTVRIAVSAARRTGGVCGRVRTASGGTPAGRRSLSSAARAAGRGSRALDGRDACAAWLCARADARCARRLLPSPGG
mgnify:CR=1 FL=1